MPLAGIRQRSRKFREGDITLDLRLRDVTPAGRSGFQATNGALHDIIGQRAEQPGPGHCPLLEPVMIAGRRLAHDEERGAVDDLAAARERCHADVARLPEPARRLCRPVPPVLSEANPWNNGATATIRTVK
jgi:hypothetical protein